MRRLLDVGGCPPTVVLVLLMTLAAGAAAQSTTAPGKDGALPRRLTDAEMLAVRGLSANGKCCELNTHPAEGICCVGGCSEEEWACKKLYGDGQWWCSEQWYHMCTMCVDDPQHPAWTCVDSSSTLACVYKARNLLPPDGQCGPTQNHGEACKAAMSRPPCGGTKDCAPGHDDCL